MNERQLLKLKASIDEAKTKASELRGQRQVLLQELERQWGCKNIKQAELKLAKLKDEAAKLQQQINTNTTKLSEEIKAYETT